MPAAPLIVAAVLLSLASASGKAQESSPAAASGGAAAQAAKPGDAGTSTAAGGASGAGGAGGAGSAGASGSASGPASAGQEVRLRLAPSVRVPRPGDQGTVFLRADGIGNTSRTEIEATGNVELRSYHETMTADWLLYDSEREEVWARGNVRIRRGGDTVTGSELRYRRGDATGHFSEPQFTLTEVGGRGTASEFLFAGPDDYKARDATYTSCRADDDSWYVRVGELDIDKERSVGTARNATIVFHGWPILWTPYLDFPLSDENKTGFLAPSFGSSSRRGFEFRLPFYWSIAPNYDATITPRLMTKRGVQLNGQFRYLFPGIQGEANAEYLPNDRITETDRYGLSWRHNQDLGRGFGAYLNLNKVSDDTYFADLGERISVTSQTNLPREGGIGYSSPWLSALARVQRFQTLQDPSAPIVPPYERLPQLLATMTRPDVYGFDLGALAEYVDFRHPTLVNGERTVLYPTASYGVRTPAWFLTGRAGLHMRHYKLDDPTLADDSISLSIPTFSLDAGLAFERDASFWGRDFLQTLEPRAFYVYIPYRSQSQIPAFDTALADLSFAQLFSENRYVGQDRVNDANQITLALTSRLIDERTGAERFRFAIGQRFYFTEQRVTLNEPPRTRTSTDFLLAAGGRISPAWFFDSGLQFNADSTEVERFNALVRYTPAPGRVLGGGYRYVRELIDATGNVSQINQIDLAGQWPLWGNWSGVARWNYSFEDRRVLEGIAGLEYNGDCWALRIVGHRLATTTDNASSSVYVQLELNGLSRLGTNPLDLLRRNIPGYFKINEPLRGMESLGGSIFEPRF